MAYRELLPHPALQPFVDRFWILSAAAGAGPRRILPDGCIDVILDVDPGGDGFGQATAVGTMTRAMLFHPRTRVRSAAVRFRPGGAAPFLRLPAHALTDRVVEAGDADARWLAPADSDPQSDPFAAVAALERRLLARLQAIDGLDRAVAHAIGRLFSAAPPSIDELGRELGWSRQHLARRFRTAVGVGTEAARPRGAPAARCRSPATRHQDGDPRRRGRRARVLRPGAHGARLPRAGGAGSPRHPRGTRFHFSNSVAVGSAMIRA